jgi:predicted DNA-binding transcriptional regulator AlpA
MNAIDRKIFIRPAEIKEIYGISRSTAYRLMKNDKFPKLISLTEGCRGWRKLDLDSHFKAVA